MALLLRTELFFGRSRPNGLPEITEVEFDAFLDEHVGPRFPRGYTVYDTIGRWMAPASKTPVIERSKVLMVLAHHTAANDARFSQIVLEYKARFQQDSVLRTSHRISVEF